MFHVNGIIRFEKYCSTNLKLRDRYNKIQDTNYDQVDDIGLKDPRISDRQFLTVQTNINIAKSRKIGSLALTSANGLIVLRNERPNSYSDEPIN